MCQMLKALTPALTLALSVALRLESPSRAEIGCVVLITLGTTATTRGALVASPFGLAMQLGANMAEAMRMVLSQKLLADMRLPLFEMQYHVAPPQLLCLLLASLAFELRSSAERSAALDAVISQPLPFVGAALLGLLLQVAGLLAVKIAGAVAVKLLGIARGAALVLFEAIRAQAGRATSGSAPPSALQLAGYGLSLGSFALYTRIRVAAGSRGGSRVPARKVPCK